MIFESLIATGAVTGYLLAASPNWCAPARPAQIVVRTEKWQPGVDLSKNSAALQRFDIDTINPYGKNVQSKVGGLTQAAIEVKQRISVSGARLGPDQCLWFDRVEITVALKPTIYVASEYARGSCRFNAIWGHELMHVEVDQRLLDKYKPLYDRVVRDAVQSQPVVGPYRNKSNQVVQDQMINRLKVAAGAITQRMKVERNTLQQRVDTLAEYERVRKTCPPSQ